MKDNNVQDVLYSDEQADVNSFDSAAFFELVTKFELRSFAIYNNYNTWVTSVLSNISVQNSLKNFKYYNCNLSECLEVLTLFSKYRLLETIEIECWAKNTDGYLQRITEAQIKIKHSNKNIRIIEIIYI